MLDQVTQTTGILRCLECGKCSAVCPVARYNGGFSPRRTVGQALAHRDEELLDNERLWTCINCLQCNSVCPANVDYAGLTLAVRVEAHRRGQAALCTHGQAIHVWMRRMTEPTLSQNRLAWLEPPLKYEISDVRPGTHPPAPRGSNSDTLFYMGCAPYYVALFSNLDVPGTRVARSGVHILNALGIAPIVLADERCCGHDLLWEGDVERFLALARLNAEMLNSTGAKRIVSTCPECVRALKIDYPAYGIRLNAVVLHISELVADAKLNASRTSKTVTYHDPCRLGRHLNIYDAPRHVLQQLGYRVVEMPHNRRNATCCGTNGWTHCDAANKAIQIQRLREAHATGAEVMVMACLKCQIHFKCALMDQELKRDLGMEMADLTELVAKQL